MLIPWTEREKRTREFGFDLNQADIRHRLTAAGCLVVPVVGGFYHAQSLQGDCFAVGQVVSLVPEPDNIHDPNAVGVWSADRVFAAGYIAADRAREVSALLPTASLTLCVWESWGDGPIGDERVAIRVLIAPFMAEVVNDEAWGTRTLVLSI